MTSLIVAVCVRCVDDDVSLIDSNNCCLTDWIQLLISGFN